MKFVDEADITVRSGKGGNGLVSFRREKYVPRGGPDGGDGGHGGNVVFLAESNLKTLLDFKYRRLYKAANGAPGGSNRKTGKSGKDLVLRVPVGTVIHDRNGEILADLDQPGQSAIVARGGKRGAGNHRFALPWRQAPDFATQGKPGEELEVRLELKLIADIGIVGLPNAGKSTLINRISRAKAKVADYPFTTLVPNLGVVEVDHGRSFVVADMPGLIQGAADGTGLGLQFLRHCERARALVHLVDVSTELSPVEALDTIAGELAAHGDQLQGKPRVIVASKIDVPGFEDGRNALEKHAASLGVPFMAVSALTGEGIPDLVWRLADLALTDNSHPIT
ncbi:MAG: GTPase ObgE [Deltaproteobacteria bacterium]|nr:GTPase ObgE [Deltaproteobacteria bacterium]